MDLLDDRYHPTSARPPEVHFGDSLCGARIQFSIQYEGNSGYLIPRVGHALETEYPLPGNNCRHISSNHQLTPASGLDSDRHEASHWFVDRESYMLSPPRLNSLPDDECNRFGETLATSVCYLQIEHMCRPFHRLLIWVRIAYGLHTSWRGVFPWRCHSSMNVMC